MNKDYIEQLECYVNSLKEGDNITVTCDLLETLEGVLKLVKLKLKTLVNVNATLK